MAATQILCHTPTAQVHLFEKRAGYGRKLLIAGSSGLNISHEAPLEEFAGHYSGFNSEFWKKLIKNYGPSDWVQFIEKELGLETFLGTSQRYFVREMKASNLLKKWIEYLETRGAVFHASMELVDFSSTHQEVMLSFRDGTTERFEKAIFALGGASWEDAEPTWAGLFRDKNLKVIPFEPSNVGYEVAWSEKFLAEAEGKPLKKVRLTTSRGEKLGELVVTRYGLEGTPIYFTGVVGEAFLDLKPDLTHTQILEKMNAIQENLAPIRRVKRSLGLSEAAEALVFHHTPEEVKKDLQALVSRIKKFPLNLLRPRPLSESISSRGGLALEEIHNSAPCFELKKFPGIYCIGELLDWDAPTGGFLIQACISQGAKVGQEIAEVLQRKGEGN